MASANEEILTDYADKNVALVMRKLEPDSLAKREVSAGESVNSLKWWYLKLEVKMLKARLSIYNLLEIEMEVTYESIIVT